MSRRFAVRTVVLAWALAAAGLAPAAEKKNKAAADDKEFFGLTKVHRFHLEFTPQEWQAIEPARGGGFFGFGGGGPRTPPAPPPVQKPNEPKRETYKGGSFNVEYPWVHGTFVAEGRTYSDVGFRYKGGGSYVVSVGKLKRNLKVDLDRYHEGQQFHGFKTVNLNAGVMDLTKWREALAYNVYRAAGVPAPRTAYAEVTLTVPGKYDKEFVGLYTVVEPVDKVFLKNHFKSSKGLLLKPEGVRLLEHLGDDWARYKDRYRPKREPTKQETQRIIAFAELVNRADDEQFQNKIGSFLDIDAFLRFLGVTAMLANLDSTFVGGHNAYLYLDPKTNKFSFIPWDLDLAFGGFFVFGGADQQTDLSLTHPYPGESKLVERLLAIKEISAKYQKVLQDLAANCFVKEKLLKDIDAVEMATKEILARESKAAAARKETPGFGFGPPGGRGAAETPDLRKFVEKRTVSIAAQLSGKSKGTIPAGMGFGGFRAAAQPGKILAASAQDQLKLTAEQKKQVEAMQKEVDAKLKKLLTEEQWKQLQQMQRGPGPRGGPPGGAGGPGAPARGPGVPPGRPE